LSRAAVVPLTVEQYQRMIEEGIVPEDSTVELLRGVMVRKDRSVIGEDPMGHSPLHRVVVALLTKLAAKVDDGTRHLQIQLPVVCPPHGEPEPDAAIVAGWDESHICWVCLRLRNHTGALDCEGDTADGSRQSLHSVLWQQQHRPGDVPGRTAGFEGPLH